MLDFTRFLRLQTLAWLFNLRFGRCTWVLNMLGDPGLEKCFKRASRPRKPLLSPHFIFYVILPAAEAGCAAAAGQSACRSTPMRGIETLKR